MVEHSIGVIGLLTNPNGEYFIGKKGMGYGGDLEGKWHVPGGHLKKGETDTDCLRREYEEETGMKVQPGVYLGSHVNSENVEVRWFTCITDAHNFTPVSDLIEGQWVPAYLLLALCIPRISTWPDAVIEEIIGQPVLK